MAHDHLTGVRRWPLLRSLPRAPQVRYVHAARKVAGVGSAVGTHCYILLLAGRDHNDPLFLPVKEAQALVLERFAGNSAYAHHGERVVAGQP